MLQCFRWKPEAAFVARLGGVGYPSAQGPNSDISLVCYTAVASEGHGSYFFNSLTRGGVRIGGALYARLDLERRSFQRRQHGSLCGHDLVHGNLVKCLEAAVTKGKMLSTDSHGLP